MVMDNVLYCPNMGYRSILGNSIFGPWEQKMEKGVSVKHSQNHRIGKMGFLHMAWRGNDVQHRSTPFVVRQRGGLENTIVRSGHEWHSPYHKRVVCGMPSW